MDISALNQLTKKLQHKIKKIKKSTQQALSNVQQQFKLTQSYNSKIQQQIQGIKVEDLYSVSRINFPTLINQQEIFQDRNLLHHSYDDLPPKILINQSVQTMVNNLKLSQTFKNEKIEQLSQQIKKYKQLEVDIQKLRNQKQILSQSSNYENQEELRILYDTKIQDLLNAIQFEDQSFNSDPNYKIQNLEKQQEHAQNIQNICILKKNLSVTKMDKHDLKMRLQQLLQIQNYQAKLDIEIESGIKKL